MKLLKNFVNGLFVPKFDLALARAAGIFSRRRHGRDSQENACAAQPMQKNRV